jgi:hypothetical protein
MAVLLVLLSFAIAGGLFVFGLFRMTTSQLELGQANRDTQSLIEQQAQYRIATDVATAVAQAQEAQRVATNYELEWAPILRQIQASLEPGSELTAVEIENQAPWADALTVEDVLRTPRIATVVLTVNSPTISGPLLLNERLSKLTGYADSVILSTVVGTDGIVTTKISLTLSTAAVSARFVGNDQPGFGDVETDEIAPAEGAGGDAATTDDESATTDEEN